MKKILWLGTAGFFLLFGQIARVAAQASVVIESADERDRPPAVEPTRLHCVTARGLVRYLCAATPKEALPSIHGRNRTHQTGWDRMIET